MADGPITLYIHHPHFPVFFNEKRHTHIRVRLFVLLTSPYSLVLDWF